MGERAFLARPWSPRWNSTNWPQVLVYPEGVRYYEAGTRKQSSETENRIIVGGGGMNPRARVKVGGDRRALTCLPNYRRLNTFVAALLFAVNLPVTASIRSSLPGESPPPEGTLAAPIPPGDTELWQRRAAAGDAYAQWVVGAQLMQSGPTHRQAALAALKQSAENGYARAALHWGRVLLQGNHESAGDAAEGVRWIERAEQSGNAEAAYVLADVYWNGWAGAVDRSKSVQWLRRAAAKGWAPARSVLGLMLRDGIEIAQDASEAVHWLELAAHQGRPEAKFAWAEMLSTGQGIAPDEARALRLYSELAKAGYLPAEQRAAKMIAEGRGAAPDTAPLRAYLEKSAQAGNVASAVELGLGLIHDRLGESDRAAGVRWLERAAAADHPLAQFHRAGEGLAAERRVQWLERAARLGHTSAEFGLGMAYAYGDGVPTDDRTAVEWYRRAAEKGHYEAQSSLGWRYLHGVTLAKDPAQALVWMRRSAAQGNPLSMRNLVGSLSAHDDPASQDEALLWIRRLAEMGSAPHQSLLGSFYSGDVPEFGTRRADQAEALRWWRKAAAQGDGAAEVALGNAYSAGRGVPADMAQAIRWWERAALRGDKAADLNLARAYLFGWGGTLRNAEKVRLHLTRADRSDDPGIRKQAADLRNPFLRWVDAQGQIDLQSLRRAAETGDREAQRLLGTAYLQGDMGLPKSLADAYPWWLKAAAQGDPEAMNNVGYTLYRGFLGKTDLVAARRWFEQAARAGFSNSMVSLARMNARGEAGKANPGEALDWLLKAGQANNPQAIHWLVTLYRNGGLGQAADPKRAAYWEARLTPVDNKGTP